MKPLYLLAAVALMHATAFAQTQTQKKSLAGIPSVTVIVEPLSAQVPELGVTESQIKNDIELILRRNGIRVISNEECSAIVGCANFYLNLNITEVSSMKDFFSFAVDLEVEQFVSLARKPDMMLMAVTYSIGFKGTAGRNQLKNLRESIKDKTETFANHYLEMNPK
jgi:hypothetical protein